MCSNAELDINAFRSAHMRSNAELDINVFRSAHMRSNAELDINVFRSAHSRSEHAQFQDFKNRYFPHKHCFGHFDG